MPYSFLAGNKPTMINEVHNLCYYLEIVRYASPETIRKYKLYLTMFFRYIKKRGIYDVSDIKLSLIEDYKKYLYKYYNDSTTVKAISNLRGYFKYRAIIDAPLIHYERIENIKSPYGYYHKTPIFYS